MIWANFLHIYQPYNQDPDIVKAVVNQSYRPIVKGINEAKDAKLTININASLTQIFKDQQYDDVIDGLIQAGRDGKVEFTSSAKFHALLPFLPEDEIIRQIKINDQTNRDILGEAYHPKGIFLPEMAFSPKLIPILEKIGFEWVILDEIAYNGETDIVKNDKLYRAKGTNLKLIFRQRRISNLIMSATVRNVSSLLEIVQDDLSQDIYKVTGMDGETFGHHRPGLENLLFEMFADDKLPLVRVSDILDNFIEVEDVEPVACTWASSPMDIERGIQFITWDDPENEIHKLEWSLYNMAVNSIKKLSKNDDAYNEIRSKLDVAEASDLFFWASARPWWSIEMIEEGSYALLEVLEQSPVLSLTEKIEARQLYNTILTKAFEWKRSGRIYQIRQERDEKIRIPFKERTFEVGGVERGVYEAFVSMMKDLEKKAVKNGDYEQAITWRDSLYKLENKTDIYDAVHSVDLLRVHISNSEVEKIINQYKEKYRHMRGGQPEQRE